MSQSENKKTNREELQKANNSFKASIDDQIDDLKGGVTKAGRGVLIVGGALLATVVVSSLLSTETDNDALPEIKKKKGKTKTKRTVNQKEDGTLLKIIKHEALVFLLGLAAERLAAFLKEIKEETNEK